MRQDLWILDKDLVHDEDGAFANAWARVVEHRDEVVRQVASEVGCDDVREAIEGSCDVGRVRGCDVLRKG